MLKNLAYNIHDKTFNGFAKQLEKPYPRQLVNSM